MNAQLSDYGPGDEITWGECTGHPNDPRTDVAEPPDIERVVLDPDAAEEAMKALRWAAYLAHERGDLAHAHRCESAAQPIEDAIAQAFAEAAHV